MTQENQLLQELLINADLLDQSKKARPQLSSPWFVKILVGISGWVAAAFIFAFVAFGLELLDSPIASIFLGGITLTVVYFILRHPQAEFMEQAALAASLAGQALMITGLYELRLFDQTLQWVMILVLEFILVLVIVNFIHRVLCAAFMFYSLFLVMGDFGVSMMFEALLGWSIAVFWLNEFNAIKRIKLIQGLGYGALLAILLFNIIPFFLGNIYHSGQAPLVWLKPWFASLLQVSALVYVGWVLMQRMQIPLLGKVGLLITGGAILVSICSLEIEGLNNAILIALVGFSGSNRVIQGIGLLLMIYSASLYYYMLDITLLEKSQHLMIVGLALLIGRWLIQKILTPVSEAEHV